MEQTGFCLISLSCTEPVGLRTQFILTRKLSKHNFTVLTRNIDQVHWVKIMRQFNGILMCLHLSFNVKYVNSILGYGLDHRHRPYKTKCNDPFFVKCLNLFKSVLFIKYVCASSLHSIYLAGWTWAYFLEYGSSYFWPIRSKKELGRL